MIPNTNRLKFHEDGLDDYLGEDMRKVQSNQYGKIYKGGINNKEDGNLKVNDILLQVNDADKQENGHSNFLKASSRSIALRKNRLQTTRRMAERDRGVSLF